MQLNLPIRQQLDAADTILIAGAGGGFDVYAGLPLVYHLEQLGKTVHIANYSFTPIDLARICGKVIDEAPEVLFGAVGKKKNHLAYYPEGYLAEWYALHHETERVIWMFDNPAVLPLQMAYQHLVKKLKVDALILVDGGVDSLMRGDEVAPGSLLEDTISLVAIDNLDVPVKILATIGFGTEVEEGVNHYYALENIAGLSQAGGFYGSCSLTHQMDEFAYYEAACRYAWEGSEDEHSERHLSHISTRVIPAAQGYFGDYRMYDTEKTRRLVSPLMSIYWFFDASVVVERSLCADALRGSVTKDDARMKLLLWLNKQTTERGGKRISY